jgi:hypothetical protein
MTEAEWLACTDPYQMLVYLMGKVSDRKYRLFLCGYCRSVWTTLPKQARDSVKAAEQFAEGLLSVEGTWTAYSEASRVAAAQQRTVGGQPGQMVGAAVKLYMAAHAAKPLRCQVRYWISDLRGINHDREVRLGGPPLLRCVAGNPFRPVIADPRWRTSTALGLAETIYADRAFDRLPILADALEDAGCDNADLLAHCRGEGPHVRGCWVVDLILGKE